MKLTSVRALKEQLLESGTPPPVMTYVLGGPVSSRLAEALEATHTRTPTLVSLGIARGKRSRDYRLGVRIHAHGAEATMIEARIAATAKGEADIKIVPRVAASPPSAQPAAGGGAWFRERVRPLEAGLSTGHHRITAGTLGFFVEDQTAYYMLSNNHVLADVNAGEPGDPVLQPGPIDHPTSPDNESIVAVLDRFVPISFMRSNLVDCAIAQILPEQEFYGGWSEAIGGFVQGWRAIDEDDLGTTVYKAGRTTGVTSGFISQVEIDRLRVDMGAVGAPRIASFSTQFEVQGHDGPFSLGGDSGSLIVHADGHAVGLLFAGGPSLDGIDLTYANLIGNVLQRLGVTLVT